jgi:hypothetical protein
MSSTGQDTPKKSKLLGIGTAKVVILLLLLVILYHVVRGNNENFGFRGMSYTAGATQRVVGQEFSGTNQMPYESGYNTQVLDRLPGVPLSPAVVDNLERVETFAGQKQTRGPLKQEEILAAQLYNEHFTSPDDLVKQELSSAKEFSA